MVNIRKAIKSDSSEIVKLISELAEYEKCADEAVATVEAIEKTVFCQEPKVFALMAEVETDGKLQVAGFALYFFNYSTFLAKHGIYLEDLYVRPEFRSKRVGFQLFKKLAEIAKSNDCGRIDWVVLDWNQLAIDFYKRIGAVEKDEWAGYRLQGESIDNLLNL